jgi:hypothetical protein
MSLLVEERLSDSPYIEAVMHGHTAGAGSTVRPAEIHWHMVFVREHGNFHPLMVGALTSSGVVAWGEGAEILWIKFKLGAFMPHLPVKEFVDAETPLPGAMRQSFWLKSAAWQCPDFDNVETFVNRLVREEILVRDPLVNTVLQEQPHDMAARTLRHRFLRATGLTQCHIRQFERAQQAATRLRQGASILDTVYELGYFDQPHLTRSLKQFVGHTPAQILGLTSAPSLEMSQPA